MNRIFDEKNEKNSYDLELLPFFKILDPGILQL